MTSFEELSFLEYNPFFFCGLENQLSTKIMCKWCANTRDIFSAQQQHSEDQRCGRQNSQKQKNNNHKLQVVHQPSF